MTLPEQATPPSEQQRGVSEANRSLALYIHIPFCETKCPYCDFNTYSGIEAIMPEYIEALVEEVDLWAAALNQSGSHPTGRQSISTVFFGGGTPSYVSPESIRRVLDTVRSAFSLAAGAEVTMESNPGDVTLDRLQSWKEAGVHRLSIGVQSLDDGLLTLLGRRHSAETARQAFHNARRAGFGNVSLDLMYGLPHQTLAQWRNTITETLSLRPEHLSLYCLTLEEGTPLEAWVRQSKVPDPDPDLAADMYLLAEELVDRGGYEHYEISNWALPGRACQHNLTYWRNQPYLGVGPGAHSSLSGYRFADVKSPQRYIQRVRASSQQTIRPSDLHAFHQHGLVDMVEAIDQPLEMAETMMLGLRLSEGVGEEDFLRRFGASIMQTYGSQVAKLEELGLLEWKEARLKLTPRGRLLGNEVFQRFFAK